MNKNLIVVVGAVSYCSVAHGFIFEQNNYCLQPNVRDGTGNMPCHWCAASGVPDDGTCKALYAGCYGRADIVSVGNSVRDAKDNTIKCTQNGWCYTSCSGIGHWGLIGGDYGDAVEVWYDAYGCQCEQYVGNTNYVRCAVGYYGVPDRLDYEGCQRCPDFGNVQANSTPGTYGPDDVPNSAAGVLRLNTGISSCFIPGSGGYSDDTGTFMFTDICCYDGTSDCVNAVLSPELSIGN